MFICISKLLLSVVEMRSNSTLFYRLCPLPTSGFILPLLLSRRSRLLGYNPLKMSYTNTVLLTGGTSGLDYYAALNIAQKQP